jgi:hypothetical protein
MTAQSKLLVFVTAFGTAIAAAAQGAEPSGAAVPVIPDPNPAIMPSGNATPPATQPSGNATAPATQSSGNAAAPATQSAQPSRNAGAPAAAASQQNRVPANRQDDAVRACSDVPAADVEACIARENARKQNVGTSASRTQDASKGSTSLGGGKPMGSAGGDSANADAATKK